MGHRLCVAAVLALAGCGAQEDSLAAGCTDDPATLVRALEKAPAAVVLADGSRLSECVRNARSDGELQNVGISMSRAADRLLDRAQAGDDQAAVALGYLTGAARRGGDQTNGVGVELVRRIELRAGSLAKGSGALAAEVQRGLRAGQADG
jgi:uncharacterized lipoprotein YajG